jgi:hypothetical protein
MTSMWSKLLILAAVVISVSGQADLDDIINSIFTKPPGEDSVSEAPPAPFPTLPPENNKPNPLPAEGANQVSWSLTLDDYRLGDIFFDFRSAQVANAFRTICATTTMRSTRTAKE